LSCRSPPKAPCRRWRRSLWYLVPTALGAFQDRCLKLLGHPSNTAPSTPSDGAVVNRLSHNRRRGPQHNSTPKKGVLLLWCLDSATSGHWCALLSLLQGDQACIQAADLLGREIVGAGIAHALDVAACAENFQCATRPTGRRGRHPGRTVGVRSCHHPQGPTASRYALGAAVPPNAAGRDLR